VDVVIKIRLPKNSKTCISFRILPVPLESHRSTSLAAVQHAEQALRILDTVRKRLQDAGLAVSKAENGKLGEAGMSCSISKSSVALVAFSSRPPSLEYWQIRTFLPKSRGKPKGLLPTQIDEWERICSIIEESVKDQLEATEIQWISHREAECQIINQQDGCRAPHV
jgi:hypothetical protein